MTKANIQRQSPTNSRLIHVIMHRQHTANINRLTYFWSVTSFTKSNRADNVNEETIIDNEN